MVTEKQELVIRIFCLVVVIALCWAVYERGKDLDCNKCQINFKSYKRTGQSNSNKVYQDFKLNISLIYNDFQNDFCIVVFDKEMGYIRNDQKF